MFERWGRAVHRWRWPILVLALGAMVFAGVWGTGVFAELKASGGFDTPGSDSAKATQVTERDLGRGEPDVIVLYRSATRTVDNPAYKAAVTRALTALPAGKVASTRTYWSANKSPQLVSHDRRSTYVAIWMAGADEEQRRTNYESIKTQLPYADDLTTTVGGPVATQAAISDQVSADLAQAEKFSMPVLMVLLVIMFGSVAAASLPLAVSGLAILGSFTALRLLTLGTDVSIFAINITTFLGLGLAIDYGLFMVGRFREELNREDLVSDALARTMATAGRTIMVSGVTVAVALAGLMLFPQTFLRSMGYGGVATVAVDMIAALTVLPALLAIMGRRVNALPVRRRMRLRRPKPLGSGAWFRVGRGVMRRPLFFILITGTALVALGLPFTGISWGGIDSKVLPVGAESRVVSEALEKDFPRNVNSPIDVVVTGLTAPADEAAYIARLRKVPGISEAEVAGARGGTVRITMRYEADAMSTEARAIVQRVREVPVPPGTDVYVGGATAQLVDQLDSLTRLLPWLGLLVGSATFVLLFMAFGSVLLPLKAIAMNALSLTAAFGSIVWIFQEGHLSQYLDFTATGTISPSMPILMLAMLFGLSMDYEVFLLSRMREQYDLTGDNSFAVAAGLQRTGGVITAAALLFVVVIGFFSMGGISFIKMLGVGMVIGIVVDATIVRALLVPATMRLLGRANWWAPRSMARIYRRYGIKERDTDVPFPAQLEPARV